MKLNLPKALEKARQGGMALRKLNLALAVGVPFNRPHRIRVDRVGEHSVRVRVPYNRKNQNHLRGIHACALATGAEFCSGLMLLRLLDPRRVRLIMQKLEVKYFYQAKMDALAEYSLRKDDLKLPDTEGDAVYHTCEIKVLDTDKNHLCTVKTTWQLKPWGEVRTKV